jgi:hypothetical protein
MVGYDLNRPGQNYEGLIEYLKGLGAWWHHLDSTWLVNTTKTPAEVRDSAVAFLDAGDELLVMDVTGVARAWRGFDNRGSTWLKDTFQ